VIVADLGTVEFSAADRATGSEQAHELTAVGTPVKIE
jgi:hypothetical protein